MSDNPFDGAPMIYRYTRAQAIEDGFLIDVSQLARERGFKIPVAITAGVHALCEPSEWAARHGQSYIGRLWDVLHMAALAAGKPSNHPDSRTFRVIMNDGPRARRHHELWAKFGPGDSAEPVTTIMLQGED